MRPQLPTPGLPRQLGTMLRLLPPLRPEHQRPLRMEPKRREAHHRQHRLPPTQLLRLMHRQPLTHRPLLTRHRRPVLLLQLPRQAPARAHVPVVALRPNAASLPVAQGITHQAQLPRVTPHRQLAKTLITRRQTPAPAALPATERRAAGIRLTALLKVPAKQLRRLRLAAATNNLTTSQPSRR